MKVFEHQLLPPYEYCETISRLRVHLRVHVPYHQLTVCRKPISAEGYEGEATKRTMCADCVKRTSW